MTDNQIIDEYRGKTLEDYTSDEVRDLLIEQPQLFNELKALGLTNKLNGWAITILLSKHPQLFNDFKELGCLEGLDDGGIAYLISKQPQLADEFNFERNKQEMGTQFIRIEGQLVNINEILAVETDPVDKTLCIYFKIVRSSPIRISFTDKTQMYTALNFIHNKLELKGCIRTDISK